MPEYKEMYLKLFQSSERAINTLIQAQRECEELYISQPEPDLKVLSISSSENENSMEKE
jgi:hypothetical protein